MSIRLSTWSTQGKAIDAFDMRRPSLKLTEIGKEFTMPRATWSSFEASVRGVASQIWQRPAQPDAIAGVAIDCVVTINDELTYLIEITEERSLHKVREDVAKLVTAKNHLFNIEHKFA